MVELYQDNLVDLLLPRNVKPLKLEIKKDSKVLYFLSYIRSICCSYRALDILPYFICIFDYHFSY
jgi:hypothetical protein